MYKCLRLLETEGILPARDYTHHNWPKQTFSKTKSARINEARLVWAGFGSGSGAPVTVGKSEGKKFVCEYLYECTLSNTGYGLPIERGDRFYMNPWHAIINQAYLKLLGWRLWIVSIQFVAPNQLPAKSIGEETEAPPFYCLRQLCLIPISKVWK